MSNFLKSHTNSSLRGSTTYRNSKTIPFKWTRKFRFSRVLGVQYQCPEAMKLWGYKMVQNETELLDDFNPLLEFHDFD
jgi:hypothetical protein